MRLLNYTKVILLTNKYLSEALTIGCKGYIIEVYHDAYEVEFFDENEKTITQLVVKEEDISNIE